MKKIILTIILSYLLPVMATAEDKKMRNDSPNASVMEGKHHMMNTNPNPNANASVMKGKHMMSDNPFSSHPKSGAGAKETVYKGYTVLKYKE